MRDSKGGYDIATYTTVEKVLVTVLLSMRVHRVGHD